MALLLVLLLPRFGVGPTGRHEPDDALTRSGAQLGPALLQGGEAGAELHHVGVVLAHLGESLVNRPLDVGESEVFRGLLDDLLDDLDVPNLIEEPARDGLL